MKNKIKHYNIRDNEKAYGCGPIPINPRFAVFEATVEAEFPNESKIEVIEVSPVREIIHKLKTALENISNRIVRPASMTDACLMLKDIEFAATEALGTLVEWNRNDE